MPNQSQPVAFNCPNCGAAIAPDSPSCCYCGSTVSTRMCPACYGAVSIGMQHCPHCGAGVVDSTSSQSGPFRCPRCEVNLCRISVGGNELHSCTHCGGLWANKDVFQKICTRMEEQEAMLGYQPDSVNTPASTEHKPRRAYIPCPECGKLMIPKNFSGCSGVIIDLCRDHGSWFDRNELQQIVLFIRNGGFSKARKREQLELKEQENRVWMEKFRLSALDRRLGGTMVESPIEDTSLLQLFQKTFLE